MHSHLPSGKSPSLGAGEMKPPSMNRNCICLQITERYLRLFIFICNNSKGSSAQCQRTQEGAATGNCGSTYSQGANWNNDAGEITIKAGREKDWAGIKDSIDAPFRNGKDNGRSRSIAAISMAMQWASCTYQITSTSPVFKVDTKSFRVKLVERNIS